MRLLRPISIAICLAIFSSQALPLLSGSALAQTNGWVFKAPGIDYQWFRLPDPNNVFVSRMERDNPNVTLEGMLANSYLYNGRATVRDMFSDYDGTLGYWGKQWGMRMDAVVGINGFFTVSESDPTLRSGQVQSGWYAKRFDKCHTITGFAWTQSGEAFIAGGVDHIANKQFVTFLDQAEVTQKFHGVNRPRGNDEIVLYTSHYGASTRTDAEGVEVLVEMKQPTGILPAHVAAEGVIRQVRNNAGDTAIPFDHIVLSAVGATEASLLGKSVVGQRVTISQEIAYCDFVTDPVLRQDWTNAYTAIGVDKYILKGGVTQVPQDIAQRQPMTAIAFNEDYVYFIVVDGRDPGVSRGMSNYEIAQFAKTYLSATEAATLDGGGSSTMVVDGAVVNNTTCNFTDCTDSQPTLRPPFGSELIVETSPINGESIDMGVWSTDTLDVEAIVPNGLLMVVVVPPMLFNAFPVGSTPQVFTDTALRLGPGDNYERVATIPEGSTVTVVENLNNMNGIVARSSLWWKVSYGGQVGWASLDVTQVDFPNHVYLPIIR
jgi:hypothetical protein